MKRILALWITLFVIVWPSLAHAQDVPEKLESVLTQSAERPFFVIAGLLFAWGMTQLLKSELPVFRSLPIPKPFRPLLAIVFAQLFHAIEAMAVGIRWDVALTRGFVAGASAIAMHDNGASVIAALEWVRAKASGGAAAGVLLIAVLAGGSSACTREDAIRAGAITSNELAALIRESSPTFTEKCDAPMARAVKLHDNDLAKATAAQCDPFAVAIRGARLAHIGLRAAVIKLHAGGSAVAVLVAAIQASATPAVALAEAIAAMEGGAK